MTSRVVVYSKTQCPYCVHAKTFLTNNNLDYSEINLDNDEERLKFYEENPGIRSVPQIYLDGERIGGYQDLVSKKDYVIGKLTDFTSDF